MKRLDQERCFGPDSAPEQEFRAWGHDFNASGMLANNQGQPDDPRHLVLQCPAGVTGCCGVFTPRQPYTLFTQQSSSN